VQTIEERHLPLKPFFFIPWGDSGSTLRSIAMFSSFRGTSSFLTVYVINIVDAVWLMTSAMIEPWETAVARNGIGISDMNALVVVRISFSCMDYQVAWNFAGSNFREFQCFSYDPEKKSENINSNYTDFPPTLVEEVKKWWLSLSRYCCSISLKSWTELLGGWGAQIKETLN